MVLEAAVLNVIGGEERVFEQAMKTARPLIEMTPGFVSLDLHRCMETRGRYLLLVRWESLEDHTIGFRHSDRYEQWRDLLHHFYEPFPLVEHYGETLFAND